MHVDTYFGKSVVFDNGLRIGFNWVHGNGITSKTSAVIAAYHPPHSITWVWSVYWKKPAGWLPRVGKVWGGVYVQLPLVGGIELCRQAAMPRNRKGCSLEGDE